jgi:hypothetical protein
MSPEVGQQVHEIVKLRGLRYFEAREHVVGQEPNITDFEKFLLTIVWYVGIFTNMEISEEEKR